MVSLLVVVASGCLLGLFVHRSAVGAFYTAYPAVLDQRWLGVTVAASVVLCIGLWMVASRRRRIGSHATGLASCFFCFGFTPLAATFLRSERDIRWSLGLAIITVAAIAWMLISPPWSKTVGPRETHGGSLGGGLRLCYSAPALATIAAFGVYLCTLAPSVVVGDSSEMQVVAHTLGIAHPTGYPLYTLLGKMFTLLPFGNVAFRVNLMSAVCAAVSIGALAYLLQKLTGNSMASLAGALSLAFASALWSQAVIAEVYALQALIVVSILTALLVGPGSSHKGGTPVGLWCWPTVGILFGLGLAHHRTTVLLGPAVILALLTGGRRMAPGPRVLGVTALAALSPLALYAYLPLRWPTVTGAPLSLDQFVWYVTGSGYGAALRWEALLNEPDRYAMFLGMAAGQFSLVGLGLAAVGVLWSAWRLRRVLLVSGSAFVATAAFGIAYHVPDVEVFFIPSYIVLALWIGLGIAGTVRIVSSAGISLGSRVVRYPQAGEIAHTLALGITPLFLVLPLFLVASNWTHVDRSNDWQAHDWGLRSLRYPVEPGALIIADVDKLSPLRYFYEVEQQSKSVVAVMPDTEGQCLEMIDASLRAGRPTYLARFLPDIGKKYALSSVGPLVSLRARDAVQPDSSGGSGYASDWEGQPGLMLVDVESWGPAGERDDPDWQVHPGNTISFTLDWQADRPLPYDAKTRLALVSDAGTTWYTTQWRNPVQGLYPTSLWRPRELVADYCELVVPTGLAPQKYTVTLEVGSSASGVRSRPLARLTLSNDLRSIVDPALSPVSAVFGDEIALTDVSIDSPVAAGSTTQLRLKGRAIGVAAEDYILRWLLTDGAGTTVAQGDSEFFKGEMTPTRWSRNMDFLCTLPIQVPAGLPPADYAVRLQMLHRNSLPLEVRQGWPVQQSSYLSVGRMTVIAGEGPLTNLDNKAILLRHELLGQTVRPGQPLRIVLQWQCVSPMTRDYTVFVHLLDSSGRVRAQVDRYPVGGTRPTSQWKQGEIIEDVYEIALPADLPSGQYVVEAGLYLAATMERLPVVDESLQPIDDRVVLGQIRIAE